jgi:hypothetical protein
MVLFKINGERNSGTLFLEYLLEANGFRSYVHLSDASGITYHWKHGVPSSDYKQLDDHRVVDIFIFRKLENWLVSTWKEPYHLVPIKEFGDFLVNKQESSEQEFTDYRTGRCLNEDDVGKTIFEIRYYKFHKIIEYAHNNKDVLFVNLAYLQNPDNAGDFITMLYDRYVGIQNPKKIVREIEEHTKTGAQQEKNRKYEINVDEYQKNIDSCKDIEIERFIDGIRVLG